MPYFTPTPEAAQTAAYGRALMGQAPLGYYMPQFRRDLNGLGAMRFNRSVARGMYTLPFYEQAPAGTLGDLTVDPSMLLWGIGALALGMFLLGGRHVPRAKKRVAARLRRISRRLAEA
jgi:hypothetical protein